MNNAFRIEFRENKGNLHVRPIGEFNKASARMLSDLLFERYNGTGKIFIETSLLGQIRPHGCSAFKSLLRPNRIPSERVYFKGRNGIALAPEGSKVIDSPVGRVCRCAGKCKTCRCTGGAPCGGHSGPARVDSVCV
jgi:hypothetical protein